MLTRVSLITGTVGVGKTTTGCAVAERLADAGCSTAFLDLDGLSRLWPAPTDDPFRVELVLAALGAVVGPYEEAGADHLIVSWVVDGQADVGRIEHRVGVPVTVVRLTAPGDVVAERLRARHVGPEADGLAWHLQRAPELEAELLGSDLDAEVIDTSGPLSEVVDRVLAVLAPER